MIARIICLLRGHLPRKLDGTFYVVCDRCDRTINLRLVGRAPVVDLATERWARGR